MDPDKKKLVKKAPFGYDDVLAKIGFGRYQILLFVLTGLIGIIDGSESTINSYLLEVFRNEFKITD